MNYITQALLIFLAFFIRTLIVKKARREIETQTFDSGIHKIDPLKDVEAVRMARLSIIWANICAWGFVIIIIGYNLINLF